jgi:beta-lactamase superfamily II metal-dependent hydrolase
VYEVDFVAVGEAGRHGDAIAIRFIRPDSGEYAHVVIDAGFDQSGKDLVEHIKGYYETTSVDLAILTHPDGDHIGGMGHVIRDLDVGELWLHRLDERGGQGLPAAAAVEELVALANDQGTTVNEPFAGRSAFAGALTILGPEEDWYAQMVDAQQEQAGGKAAARTRRFEGARLTAQKFLAALPIEIPFDDAGGTNARNNSAAITLLDLDGRRLLFASDAGVPSLERAWDWYEAEGGDTSPPFFVQIPHHGSRHNVSSALLDRILGAKVDAQTRSAFVNVGPEAVKHPSPRVANAFMRRGYAVAQTRGMSIRHSHDAPPRSGWTALEPLEPLDESIDED